MKRPYIAANVFQFMARKTKTPAGSRLARIRKSKGFTQAELAKSIGVSQRVIAYYENEAHRAPTQHLPKIAKALGVSVDQIVGAAEVELQPLPPKSKSVMKRLEVIETLSPQDRKMVLRLIDTLAAKEKGQNS